MGNSLTLAAILARKGKVNYTGGYTSKERKGKHTYTNGYNSKAALLARKEKVTV